MKGFNFRLESLLNIKEKFEQQAKIAFGEEVAKLTLEENKLKELYNSKAEALNTQRESFSGTIDIMTFDLYNNYISQLDILIYEQTNAVELQKIEVEKAKQKLADALKERKTLEKLEEKQLEIFKKESQLKEDKLMDEIVTYKFTTR